MKICYKCEHFDLRIAQEDWSEVTPGNDFEMICYKNHWQFNAHNESTESFSKKLETAETCPDYKVVR